MYAFIYGIDVLALHLLNGEGSEPDILHLYGTAQQEVMTSTFFFFSNLSWSSWSVSLTPYCPGDLFGHTKHLLVEMPFL